MRFLLLICLFPAALVSCKQQTAPASRIFDDKLPLQERIKLAVSDDFFAELGLTEDVRKGLISLYRSNNYQPFWYNDSIMLPKSATVSAALDRPYCLGIPSNRWKNLKGNRKELIVKELLLTAKFGAALNDIETGILDSAAKALKPLGWGSTGKFLERYSQLDTVKDYGKWFASMGPQHSAYRDLAGALYDYSFGRDFSARKFTVPSLKEDSAACYAQTRLSLIDKGYLGKNATDSAFLSALAIFQRDNGLKGDGVIGTFTRKALEESAKTKIDRAILSLERWRWRDKFPNRYIWINIPEYTLRVYYNDTLFSVHNVVVGKYDTRTPQLRSRIRNIVSFPYWTVPFSITSKEFLPALKSNPNYLAKNHLKIFKNRDEEVDPSTVNWKKIPEKTFPYRVRQEPGYHNSLGVIKFEFSNPFGVYVHDTPSKGLFRNDIRSYSHGCIRCQMPDSLARFILRRDEQKKMPADSLDSLLVRQEHRSIPLRHPVDIQVDYITVVSDGRKLTFFPDIYDRDAEYLKWMEK